MKWPKPDYRGASAGTGSNRMPGLGREPVLATTLAPTLTAPRLARGDVERHLPLRLAPLLPEVGLLTVELVTNAVLHAKSVVDLDLYLYDDGVRVAVVDFGPGVPVLRDPDRAGGGYGLHIVNEIATRWGHEPLHPRGKCVWFELRRAN